MMKNKRKLPCVILVIGLIVAVAVHFLTSVCKTPAVTEHDFPYSVTYTLDGETKTFEGVYTCRFVGFGSSGIDPLDRYYDGVYAVNGQSEESRCYTIAQKDGLELYIVTLFNDSYLMGDTTNESYAPSLEPPCLEAQDEEGYGYDETELLDRYDVGIVSWDYPEPIENTFVFAKFAWLHPVSVAAMLLVGILTLVLCVILVKKEDGVVYGALDKVGTALNFVAIFAALPIVSLAAWLIQAFPTGPDWIYQAYLGIPPIIPFTVAASVSLRRQGYRKSGFFIQFFGFAALVVLGILEYVL